LGSVLKDQIRMQGGKRADGAIVRGNSIWMVMKCESQNGEAKTNKQEMDKFSVHWLKMLINM